VNPVLTYARVPTGVTVQYFFWLHPEWWSVALSLAAWAVMFLHGWQYAGHGVHHRMSLTQELSYWMWMVAAMMLPLSLTSVRLTAARSMWARRHRAIAGFLTGYFAPWLLLGIAAACLRELPWMHSFTAPALGFLAAAWWQRTSRHKRAFIACHRTQPLAPLGWRADRDCLHFGATIGVACVRSCWPLMLACTFTGHSLIVMAGGMAVGAWERWPFRPRTRAMLAVTLALAGYYAALAVLDQSFALASLANPLRR
jgi:predicted metal-binding integral membrane protein DUF2182